MQTIPFPGRARQNLKFNFMTGIPTVPSVLLIKQTNHVEARGSDPDPGVCSKVRFESKVTKGFSFSPLRDSHSPLSYAGKIKKNLWDQGRWLETSNDAIRNKMNITLFALFPFFFSAGSLGARCTYISWVWH